jgi:hypothetical protein
VGLWFWTRCGARAVQNTHSLGVNTTLQSLWLFYCEGRVAGCLAWDLFICSACMIMTALELVQSVCVGSVCCCVCIMLPPLYAWGGQHTAFWAGCGHFAASLFILHDVWAGSLRAGHTTGMPQPLIGECCVRVHPFLPPAEAAAQHVTQYLGRYL